MSRFHMHVVVENLDISTRFYTALFGAEPTTAREDYIKWALDDPRINFVITSRGHIPGLDHVGIQTDTDEELEALQARLAAAGITGQTQKDTACCYERSNKHWTLDPQGIAWEVFHSLHPIPTFNDETSEPAVFGCCAPDLGSTGCKRQA
jgi:catechol 2,3-dioxygenase-like lactoylglutathione lyase family enzyme